ncbi:MAG TPA: energy transducer TonB [Telluria sp.]|jgi:hypothetical protein
MKKAVLIALLCAAILPVTPALADEPVLLGAANCHLIGSEADPAVSAVWKGPCKDGYAQGQGVLIWKREGKELWRYEGGLERGLRQGPGYVKYQRGDQYEGGFVNGRREGKGLYLTDEGDEYQGDWKNGQKNGKGWETYATGGRYDGAWKDGWYHGHGKASYIGGQVVETEFSGGKPVGSNTADVAPDQSSYALASKRPPVGSNLGREREYATMTGVPYDKSYAELSAQQKQTVRLDYPMLHEDDVPPYPAKGKRGASEWLHKAQPPGITGKVYLMVLVGADGKAISVKTIASPDDELTRGAVLIMMQETFTPGTCSGKPCQMMYPLHYEII